MPKTDLVQIQFRERRTNEFGGRAYTYIADVPLSPGDIVTVPTAYGDSEGRVCRVDVPESELPHFLNRDTLRHITEAATPGSLFNDFFNE